MVRCLPPCDLEDLPDISGLGGERVVDEDHLPGFVNHLNTDNHAGGP
jgi:hypothetical protein